MVKIISQGLLPRDHPMFTGGLETFSSPSSSSSFTNSPKARIGGHPVNAPETEADSIKAEALRRLKVRRMAEKAFLAPTKD